MKSSWLGRMTLTLCVWLATSGIALAADSEPGSGDQDFRGKVLIAYGTVFAVVLVYLYASHLRNARLVREIELLEERVQELGNSDG